MHKVSVVLGIRPDFIRTSIALKLLKEHPDIDATFIHTGQHYDYNLSKIFLDELDVPHPDVCLGTSNAKHYMQHAKLIEQLGDCLEELGSDVCLFLGDANATIGCIAPLKMGIPIAHIEAGMRSFSWRMPEERNRVLIDSVSDILYVYQHDYAHNLIREGVDSSKIEVVGNVIVDVIDKYIDKIECKRILGYEPGQYALMTLHRNEHVTSRGTCEAIIRQVGAVSKTMGVDVVLIEMPRLAALKLKYPTNFRPIKPVGFLDFLRLEENALIEYTDSGTNQESSALLGTPCVVTRETTERPETFDSGITFMSAPFDETIEYATELALGGEYNSNFSLGDGKSSERIVNNLVRRLNVGIKQFGKMSMVNEFVAEHFNVVPRRSKKNHPLL